MGNGVRNLEITEDYKEDDAVSYKKELYRDKRRGGRGKKKVSLLLRRWLIHMHGLEFPSCK